MSDGKPTPEERMADAVIVAIKRATEPLHARIKKLEERPELIYRGVYEADVLYRECSLVTRSGSLWLALHDTRAVPGSEPTAWRLVAKNGA
jgi:hypothetical protein